MQNEIFDKVKIRWLALIIPLSTIIMFLLFEVFIRITKFNRQEALYEVVGGYILYLVPILWAVLIFRKHNVNFMELFSKQSNGKKYKWWELGIIVGAMMIFSIGSFELIYIPLSYVFPTFIKDMLGEKSIYTSAQSSIPLAANALNFIFISILGPIIEELLFRGIIFNRFLVKWGIKVAIIVPSIIFGVFHFDFIGSFVFAIIMTLIYLKSKNIIVPIICHILNNGAVSVYSYIMYFVNGREVFSTLEQFRSELWIGIVLFVISTPAILYIIYKNWPAKDYSISKGSSTEV